MMRPFLRLTCAAALAIVTNATFATAAELSPATKAAFDKYMAATDARIQADIKAGHFLKLGRVKRDVVYPQEMKTTENGHDIAIPGGTVHHWIGALFIPGVNLPLVRSVKTDYDNYKRIYKPDVIASKLLKANGDDYDMFLRFEKHAIITAVLNVNYHVHFSNPAPNQLLIRSISTRVAEVKDGSELPVGHDRGILWALNTFWRYEEADGGVYVECETVSLSRDVPMLISGIVNSFTRRFPREGLRDTLEATRRELLARAGHHE